MHVCMSRPYVQMYACLFVDGVHACVYTHSLIMLSKVTETLKLGLEGCQHSVVGDNLGCRANLAELKKHAVRSAGWAKYASAN